MEIVLVKHNHRIQSIGVGRHCFEITAGGVEDNHPQRIGSELNGQLAVYEEAFKLACWAWKHQLFDREENN